MMYHLKFSFTGAALVCSTAPASLAGVSAPWSAAAVCSSVVCSRFNSSAIVSLSVRAPLRTPSGNHLHPASTGKCLVTCEMQKQLVDALAQHNVHRFKKRREEKHRRQDNNRGVADLHARRRHHLAHLLTRFLQELDEPLWA